jgi:hypothetical protein
MNNALPKSLSDLFTMCEKAADGLNAHESPIGIMHNPETVLREELATARTANNQFQAAKSAKLSTTDAQDTADANAVSFITAAREVLKAKLGSTYSQAWAEAGFTTNSLAVPGTLAKRMELLKSLELYFTAHPTDEVAAYATAGQATALHVALSTAVSAVNAGRGDQRAKRAARDTAAETLRNRLRGLVSELTQLIGDTDERWLDFGFRVSGDNRMPEVPFDLIVNGGAPGHLVAGWSDAPRTERYRVYKQVVGVDDEFVLATTVTDSDADLNTFTPGAQVRVKVSALNARGESQASEVVEHQVP